MSRKLIFAIIYLILVAGCSVRRQTSAPVSTQSPASPQETQRAPVGTPTLSDSALLVSVTSEPALIESTPSFVPTRTPANTATQSPSPTRTRTPTRSATPTRTLTPTPLFSPTPYPIPTGSITRVLANFRSPSLGLDREVIIYLPPGYSSQSQRRYPVLYLLHGYGGFDLQHTTEWEQWGLMQGVQDAIIKGLAQPMIFVQPNSFMPDGVCSLYFNHGPGTDGKPWGDYIWKDVVNFIDASYRTIPRRESRGIGGFSFGGQGALSIALTHPEVFRVVGGHSPSFRAADGSIGFLNDETWYNQFDPIWLVKNTDNAKQLAIWLDVATGDDKIRFCGEGSDRCLEAFHLLLSLRGIQHEWRGDWSGPHEGSYWQEHLADYLAWYSSQLAGQ